MNNLILFTINDVKISDNLSSIALSHVVEMKIMNLSPGGKDVPVMQMSSAKILHDLKILVMY